MRLHDINVLVYAHRPDSPRHEEVKQLLAAELGGDQTYGVCDFVVNGFLRVVTNRGIFRKDPTPVGLATAFADQLRHQPNAVLVAPGPRHWGIFTALLKESGVSGEDLPDAFLAALAIEHGCEFVTADKGFRRFRGLRLAEV
jgi:toxin-antitoxin system PIN domain toxin